MDVCSTPSEPAEPWPVAAARRALRQHCENPRAPGACGPTGLPHLFTGAVLVGGGAPFLIGLIFHPAQLALGRVGEPVRGAGPQPGCKAGSLSWLTSDAEGGRAQHSTGLPRRAGEGQESTRG